MKKKTRKKVIRRKRRSMREKRVMQIKRGLMKRAKKLHLGAKRTGAYVYGTLRRIVGNPGGYVIGYGPDPYSVYDVIAESKDGSRYIAFYMLTRSEAKKQAERLEKNLGEKTYVVHHPRDREGNLLVHPSSLLKGTRYYNDFYKYVRKNPMEYDVLRDKFEVMGGPITDKMQSLLRKIYNMRDSGKSEAQLRPFIKEYQRLKGLVTPLRRNPGRSSFDKPTFGPMNTETRRVDTTTMAGMKEAERLQRAGWYQGPVTLFSTTYYRKRALPKSSIARQIRGNRRYKGDARRKREADAFYSKYMGPGGDLYQRATREELAEYQNAPFSDRARIQDRVYARVQRERMMRRNPPMYAHRMMSHRTHGLSLKQMMKLYRLVSSGNPKAVMFARRTLGIPMSESLQQVKAVVYHHVLDLKGKI